MKKIYVLLCAIALVYFSFAQAGRWEGTLEVSGLKLDMIIELEEQVEAWKGSLDIPIQNVKNMDLADLSIQKETISFRLPEVPGNASFKGTFSEDFEKLDGMFTQNGRDLPLSMERRDISVDPEKLSTYTNLIDSLLNELNVAGAGIGIVKGGKVILAEGFGYRDYENKKKADANTIFAIGSSSKAFTTMGLGMLADAGQLEWDEAVVNYMPDFKLHDDFASREMTAVDLVTHQSGLPRHDFMWYATDFSRAELFDRLQYLEPTKSFRSTFQYQNLMYMTAGVLIEKLSGKTWEDYTQEKIVAPLNMKRTNFSVNESQAQENYALPYRTKEEEIVQMDFHNIDAIGPAGSINSTVNDMLNWVNFQLELGKFEGTKLIGEEQIKKMHSPHKTITSAGMGSAQFGPTSYGLGWFITNYGDTYYVQHGGNIDGFSALVALLPKEDIGIVALSNQNGSALPSMAVRYAIDLLLEKEAVDWYKPNEEKEEEKQEEEKPKQIEGTNPQHDLADYTGIYEHPGYGKMEILEKEEQLHAQYYKFEMPLTHWHFETFQGKLEALEYEILLTFQTDKSGNIVQLSAPFEASLEDIIFKKLPPDLLSDPDFLSKLAGDYKLKDMTFTVRLDDTSLKLSIPGQPTYTLVPEQDTTFGLKDLNGFSVAFTIDELEEKATEVVFYQPNGTFRSKRVEE